MANKPILEGSDVRWDASSGQPKRVRGEFDLPAADSPEDSIRAFLQDNAEELQLDVGDDGLECIHDVVSPVGRVCRFRQQQNGVPILGTEIVVKLDRAGKVKQLDLERVSQPRVEASRSITEPIKPKAAARLAADSLGQHKERQNTPKPTQAYFPTPEGLKLAYLVLIATREPWHDWKIVVDANTGEILNKEDMLVHTPDGQGLVFDPNPVVTANDDTLRDPAAGAACNVTPSPLATIDAQRVTRSLRDLKLENGVHQLDGPFARIRNFGVPNIAPPAEANANDFNYSSGDDRFEAVNVYYHIDTIQRYLQGLGITTAHNRQIEMDVHEGNGGAFFSPIDGGLHFGNSGPCRPNRGSDGDVALHEYGHAIQADQVPGWGAANPVTGRRETRAMGEGYGDVLACVFFAEHGGSFQREVFEDWVFGDVGGLRRLGSTKVYPQDWEDQEHADGQIWSAALWNVYLAIGGESTDPADRLAARDAILKTVTLSHHAVAANATMPDGAEAVMEMNAELDDFRGRHLVQMLDSFHDRGLLRVRGDVDLSIRDAPGDPGEDVFTGSEFWNSPDLWIRNSDDGGLVHQNPQAGRDNWFHARVRNRGEQTARAFVVTFNLKTWAGTQFVYPDDFVPYVSGAVAFNLAAGQSTVVKARLPAEFVPANSHACMLASVYTPGDAAPAGRHVWEHNNLAQKNLATVNLSPSDSVGIPFQLGSRLESQAAPYRVEVRRPATFHEMGVAIVHRDADEVRRLFNSTDEVPRDAEPRAATPVPIVRFLEPSHVELSHRGAALEPVHLQVARGSVLTIGGRGPKRTIAADESADEARQADLVIDAAGGASIVFRSGQLAGFPIVLQPRSQLGFGLQVTAPGTATAGDTILLDVLQRNSDSQVVGGIAIRVNIVS